MFSTDYDWIRLGFLFLACFASFSDARIDYSNGGHNSILSQNAVKGATVPASTFLLDWNQLKASAASTRDELYRMQRHAYMLSPITQQHYKGGIAPSIEGQHQFSLFNPFSFANAEQVPAKKVQPSTKLIASKTFKFQPKSNPKPALPLPQTKSAEKVHMSVEPLLPSIPAARREPDFEPTFRSRKFQRKNLLVNNDINSNHLSKFKVYEAVPGDAF